LEEQKQRKAMFKKLDEVGNMSQINKSALKNVRQRLIDMSPELMEKIIDSILPKKS
jgi:hypothetical protein